MFFVKMCIHGSDPSATYYSAVVILSPASNHASNWEVQFVWPRDEKSDLWVGENENLKICHFSTCGILITHFKKKVAPRPVAQWLEPRPAHQRVAGSIPTASGAYRWTSLTSMSLSLPPLTPSLPLSLKKKKKKGKNILR